MLPDDILYTVISKLNNPFNLLQTIRIDKRHVQFKNIIDITKKLYIGNILHESCHSNLINILLLCNIYPMIKFEIDVYHQEYSDNIVSLTIPRNIIRNGTMLYCRTPFDNTTEFKVNDGVVSSVPSAIPLLPRLKYLDISASHASYLPYIKSLRYIYISSTFIHELPSIDNVIQLDISHTAITHIVSLLACALRLKKLNISYTKIDTIVCVPSLVYLVANDTLLTEMPSFPSLKSLTVSNTRIVEIPYMPKLEYLCMQT